MKNLRKELDKRRINLHPLHARTAEQPARFLKKKGIYNILQPINKISSCFKQWKIKNCQHRKLEYTNSHVWR